MSSVANLPPPGRSHALLAAIAISMTACGSLGGEDVTPSSRVDFSVATYNLYLGADLIALFPPTVDSSTARASDLGARVRMTLDAVDASDPPERMDAVAAQVAVQPADVLILQEASLWLTQSPADGEASPANELRYDFLGLLRDALARRGLAYDVVVESSLSDVEAPGAFDEPMDVRLIDRDVILVRAGSPVVPGATERHTFEVQLTAPTEIGTTHVVRGWSEMAASVNGRSVRFVATHLEAALDQVRDAQATELLGRTADAGTVVMAGDFNFPPGSFPYRELTAGGLSDAWSVVRPGDPGPTCCQHADVRNAASVLSQRIDLVFTRGDIAPAAAERIGEDPADRSAGGLWPSDHAGVYVTLGLR